MDAIYSIGPLNWGTDYDQIKIRMVELELASWGLMFDHMQIAVVSRRVAEMIAGKLYSLKKTFVFALVSLGMTSQVLMAGEIVDLHKVQALGVLSTSETGKQIYFSLGNGRAIAFLAKTENYKEATLAHLLFQKTEKMKKHRPIRRRNLKW